jgi:ABC-2 type transport system permease protein
MAWYKSWLDTRGRFLIGFVLLCVSATALVFEYPRIENMLPLVSGTDRSTVIGRAIANAIELERSYRGFIWSQWFGHNLASLTTLFAALLGSGSPFSGSASRGVLFTLALPVSRRRWIGTRAGVGLAELLALATLPSLAIPLLSPLVGQHYPLSETVVHGACLFIVSAAFFSLALALSTVFNDLWRPLLTTCAVALVLGIGAALFPSLGGPFAVMSAESYFRDGSVPWLGLLISIAVSLVLLYSAARHVENCDF